jgi:hypothetical protein
VGADKHALFVPCSAEVVLLVTLPSRQAEAKADTTNCGCSVNTSDCFVIRKYIWSMHLTQLRVSHGSRQTLNLGFPSD